MRTPLVLLAIAIATSGCPAKKATGDGGLPECGPRGVCGTGICDRALIRCVGCRSTRDCYSDEVCSAGNCNLATGCASDSDCKAKGKLCDLTLGRCVDCRAAAECDGGQACLGFTCTAVTACTTATDCQGQQVCATASGPRFPDGFTQACQDCASASACTAEQTCYQGVCGGDACTQVSGCPSDAKTSAGDVMRCEDHRKAVNSACHALSDVLSACVLNQQTCGADGKTDLTATLARCMAESNAYTACANNP